MTLLLGLVPNAVEPVANVLLVGDVDVDVDMGGSMAGVAVVGAAADADIDKSVHVSVLLGTVTLAGVADDTGGVGVATVVLVK